VEAIGRERVVSGPSGVARAADRRDIVEGDTATSELNGGGWWSVAASRLHNGIQTPTS